MFSTMGFQLSIFSKQVIDKHMTDRPLFVVDEVTKSRRVNNGETETNTVLFDIYAADY